MTTLTRVVNDANAREALYGAELLSSSVFISPKIDSTEISRFVLLKSKLVNFLVSPNLPANADQLYSVRTDIESGINPSDDSPGYKLLRLQSHRQSCVKKPDFLISSM